MIHDMLGNAYPQQNVERFKFFENENYISTITIAFLLANQVREYYENSQSLNQLHVYKKDGNKEVQVIDSHSSWESPYRLISFEGFVFLRGITSYPIILHDIVDNKIIGTEINRKTDPVKTEIRIEQN